MPEGTDMIDIDAWVVAGAGLLTTVATAANLGRLLQATLRQRAKVELERERSARSIARTAGLTRMLRQPHATVRVVERDSDGERLIEIGLPARVEEEKA